MDSIPRDILNQEAWQGKEAARGPACKVATSVQPTWYVGSEGWKSASVTAFWISLALMEADFRALWGFSICMVFNLASAVFFPNALKRLQMPINNTFQMFIDIK